MNLDLRADPIALTAALVDIASVSRDEDRIATLVERALREQTAGFQILRHGNVVLARTDRGLPSRVILAGHLDTVPIADNVPSRYETDAAGERLLYGCGSVDMKSGDAVFLHLAATVADPAHDLTLIFYDCEEIASEFNGLGHIERELPEWLDGDLAILGEPSGGWIEAGCQGTLRARLTTSGVRAHSARAWLGDNAIHRLAPILRRLSDYRAREV
ncbi:succinyl-diaminopimelate desuccinylase, partial [Nocardia panacis]